MRWLPAFGKTSLVYSGGALIVTLFSPLKKNRVDHYFSPHLRFKQAQTKMCHSPKVEDRIERFFSFSSWTHIFRHFF